MTKQNETVSDEDVTFGDDELALLEEGTRKNIATLNAQRNQHKTKREEAEAKVKAYEAELATLRKPATQEPKPAKNDEEITNVKRELSEVRLKQAHPELDDEDITRAFAYAASIGKTTKEAISDDVFQAYLEKKAAKRSAEAASPGTSHRAGQGGENTFQKIVDNPKLYSTLGPEKRKEFNAWKEAKGL